MIKQTLDLNLIPGRVLPRVNVSQYDKGTRTLEFTIYNGEILFNPTGYTAYIQGQKPDGHGFNYAADIANQKISVDVVEQMTAVSGSVACEIVIKDGTDQIGTGNFILQVEAAALPDDATMSESDYNIIQKAVEDAQAAAEEAESWSAHAPYIGANGNWYVYDAVQEQFVDTGVQAEGPQGDDGPQGPAGPTGNGIASITKTGTSGLVDTYTITYTNGNTTTFTVTNGKDGTGSGDMSKSVYDQNNNGIVDNSEKLDGHGASYFAQNQSMTGASSGTAGATGLVPAPAAGDQVKYLKGDGTWAKPAASELSFDNTGTGMTATNPQDAITELNADITTLNVVTYSENASYPSSAVAVRERAGVVSLNIVLQTLSADISIGWTKIGTLSAHPITDVYIPCYDGTNVTCKGYAYLNTSGELHLHGSYAKANVIPVIYGMYFT